MRPASPKPDKHNPRKGNYRPLFLMNPDANVFQEAGRQKERKRNIRRLPLTCPQLGTWPSDLLVRRPELNPLSHTGQGSVSCINVIVFSYRSFTSCVKFIPRDFIHFDATANGVLPLISVSYNSLLVYEMQLIVACGFCNIQFC